MRQAKCLVTGAALLAAGCAVAPPTGPTVMALPAQGKTFAQFQADDGTCRQYASLQTGGMSPAEAASTSGVNSAAVGTLLGAAAGALLGAAGGNAGVGAAIGAGSGLAIGGLAGTGAAQASGAGLQQRYNMSYLQCMAANGESVPTLQNYPRGYYGYYYAPYPYNYGYGSSPPPQ